MDTVSLLERLVSFDTTSRNSNLPMLDFIDEVLAASNVVSRRVDGGEGKASLIARIGPDVDGGLVLCGHTDTVPVEGQPWQTDPFTLTRSGEHLIGRGAVDMKGFIASTLAAVPRLVAAELTRPIILAFTHDEEVGCLAADALAHALADEPEPAAVIVGEPTGMGLVRGHKGVRVVEVVVRGKDAHSSQPHNGANAVLAAGRIVAAIADLADELEKSGARDARFTPPWTTMNVGLINGGQAMNIIPRECRFTWSFRCVPGEDGDAIEERIRSFAASEIVPRLRANHPGAQIEFIQGSDTPCLDPAGNADAADLVRNLVGAEEIAPMAFGTDGSALQRAGFQTVIIGPGQLDQMHQPNEAIGLHELAACDDFLATIVDWAS